MPAPVPVVLVDFGQSLTVSIHPLPHHPLPIDEHLHYTPCLPLVPTGGQGPMDNVQVHVFQKHHTL